MQVYNDRLLPISDGKPPFQPDFTIIDERNDFNLFMDIEVDEPYVSDTREVIHIKGQDGFRDKYFNDSGWIVIRFTEKQVYQNVLGCCLFIATVINKINPEISIPIELQSGSPLIKENFWEKYQAERWARENERERYLELPNGFVNPTTIIEIDWSSFKQNEIQKQAEDNINRTNEFDIEDNVDDTLNSHPRDKHIQFIRETHTYLIDGCPTKVSSTTLIDKFFLDFDPVRAIQVMNPVHPLYGLPQDEIIRRWRANGEEAASKGTELHYDIEIFFKSNGETSAEHKPEFRYFLNFYNDKLKDDFDSRRKSRYRSEWRIFDDVLLIAGTSDLVVKKENGNFEIYDWKRSEKIERVDSDYVWAKLGSGPCSSITDCKFNRYSLQLNIYKFILQEYYGLTVDEMYFVQLHPDCNANNYVIHVADDMQETVAKMFEATITLKQ